MRRLKQRGFTLIELMIVVSIIGVLALVGVPHFRGYALASRLDNAAPILAEIAAKMRMQMLETGEYCCGSNPSDEDNIVDELKVPLKEHGDFCFMIICQDAGLCQTVNGAGFIAPSDTGDATVEFEVWAVLREAASGDVASPDGNCKPATDKRPPSGWVRPSTASDAGRQGQVVVFRYPPPVNGVDAAAGAGGKKYVWDSGVSKTHASHP